MYNRRSSYAAVASGSTGTGNSQSTDRAGTFSQLFASATATALSQSQGQSRLSRSIDADGHSSMAGSYGRSGPPPSGHLPGLGGSTVPDLEPFFVPSYLRGSKHAEKLHDVHLTRLAAHQEYKAAAQSTAGSLSTSASSVNLAKTPPTYRGLTNDIVERCRGEAVWGWPTRWADNDKFPQLDLEDSGRQAKFTGAQKTHDEAAAVRADCAMPEPCGIYYYEVTVISKGKDGRMIGVGFSGPKVALSRIPGWEPDSFAYHGDDGQIFSNSTSGKAYGPKFGTLDVIGCGINFRTKTAFFTKNGHMLGTAFRDLGSTPYLPTVGMKKPGETLRANFGQEPFAFDIDRMMRDEKAAIQAEITSTTGVHQEAADETDFIHQLIGQYLAHDGYVETAREFSDEIIDEARALANEDDADVPYREAKTDLDALNRQNIRQSILNGDIDKAIKHTQAYYPSVLPNNENIYFKLRCRKFIEMIQQSNELKAQSQPAPASFSKHSAGKRHSAATDEYDFEMELDEQLGVHNPPLTLGKDQGQYLDEDEDDIEQTRRKAQQLTEDTLKYGMELQSEFANDPRREVKQALHDTFALIAYEDVRDSALAPLLDAAGRVPVAEELNSAILVSLGKPPSSALERLIQQTEALVTELTVNGGPGAFVNVRRDFLQ